MSNYVELRNILRKMSGQDSVITIPKIYIDFTGDLTTAAILNQLVFYSDKGKRSDGFFYKSYKEWEEETGLTKRQVSYSIGKIKELGLVETKLKKANGSPTIHYKLDYDKLLDSIVTKCHYRLEQNVTIDSDKVSQSLTENTTENTTENNISTSKIPYKDIIDYLNEKADKRFKHTTANNQKFIRSRWNEGNTLDDFKRVIDIKVSQWKNDKDMNQYLRPQTLFGTKFESYLNEKPINKPLTPQAPKEWSGEY